VVGQNAINSWLLSFASPAFHLTKGSTAPIDVTFDGQFQARPFATANSEIMLTAIMPPNVARTFQKASLMVAQAGNTALNFNLTSTGRCLGRSPTASVRSRPADQQRRRIHRAKTAAAKSEVRTIPNRPGPVPRPVPDSRSAQAAISSPTIM